MIDNCELLTFRRSRSKFEVKIGVGGVYWALELGSNRLEDASASPDHSTSNADRPTHRPRSLQTRVWGGGGLASRGQRQREFINIITSARSRAAAGRQAIMSRSLVAFRCSALLVVVVGGQADVHAPHHRSSSINPSASVRVLLCW